jgi:hypothetical protein
MRSRQDYRPPILARFPLGGLGKVTVAEAIVIGVIVGLVMLVWRHVV